MAKLNDTVFAGFYNPFLGMEYLIKMDYNYGNKPEVGGVANEQKKPKRSNSIE